MFQVFLKGTSSVCVTAKFRSLLISDYISYPWNAMPVRSVDNILMVSCFSINILLNYTLRRAHRSWRYNLLIYHKGHTPMCISARSKIEHSYNLGKAPSCPFQTIFKLPQLPLILTPPNSFSCFWILFKWNYKLCVILHKAFIDQRHMRFIQVLREAVIPSLLCVILLYKSTIICLFTQLFEMFPVTNDIVSSILYYLFYLHFF